MKSNKLKKPKAIKHVDKRLTKAAMKLSEKSFDRVWNNKNDAIYDKQ